MLQNSGPQRTRTEIKLETLEFCNVEQCRARFGPVILVRAIITAIVPILSYQLSSLSKRADGQMRTLQPG